MEKTKLPRKFKVGEIALDEGGNWWVMYFGQHANQGGFSLQFGSLGSSDLKFLCKVLFRNSIKYKKELMDMITKRTENE